MRESQTLSWALELFELKMPYARNLCKGWRMGNKNRTNGSAM